MDGTADEKGKDPLAFDLLPWHEARRLAIINAPGRKRKPSNMPPRQESPQRVRASGARKRWNGEDYRK